MNPIIRNILAVIAGIVVGSLVNGMLIGFGGAVIAPPSGVDPSNLDSIKASIHLFEPKHFLFPFLAHAVGTLVGAFVATFISASRSLTIALIIGGLFLIGGIAASLLIPAPAWFIATDLILAYIPAALLGRALVPRKRESI
jgi:hypothetical protein